MKNTNNCPKCGEKSISNFEKLCLGPASTTRCSVCNTRISVSWWPAFIMGLSLFAMYYLGSKLSLGLYFCIGIVIVPTYLYLHVKIVPLVERKENGYS